MKLFRFFICCMSVAALSACAVYYPQRRPAPVIDMEKPHEEHEKALDQEYSVIEEQPTTELPAVASLLQEADALMAQDEYSAASVKLERASRIQPQNALVWYRLAEVRYQEGEFAMAKQLAIKAQSLAAGDPNTAQKSQILIDRINFGHL